MGLLLLVFLIALLAAGWTWLRRSYSTDDVELTPEEQAVVDQVKGLRDMRFDRSSREVHGMTAYELLERAEMRAEFDDIVRASWPTQT